MKIAEDRVSTDENSYWSQSNEDRVLEGMFSGQLHGICVEVGANDGVTGSATMHFEKKGWTCLLVEPIPVLAERIRNNRSCTISEYAASSQDGTAVFFVAESVDALSTLDLSPQRRQLILGEGGTIREITVKTRTLDRILADHNIRKTIDFITIDVEGHELDVLKGFSLAVWQPRIVIVEDSSLQRDDTILRYMAKNGYVNFKRTGVNDWYARPVDSDYFDVHEMKLLDRARRRAKFEHRIVRRFARISAHLPGGVKKLLRKGLSLLARRVR